MQMKANVVRMLEYFGEEPQATLSDFLNRFDTIIIFCILHTRLPKGSNTPR
jgi:hypothetical protein